MKPRHAPTTFSSSLSFLDQMPNPPSLDKHLSRVRPDIDRLGRMADEEYGVGQWSIRFDHVPTPDNLRTNTSTYTITAVPHGQ